MTDNQQNSNPIEYKSLAEIRIRKDMILNSIKEDDAKIKMLWNDLFSRPVMFTSNLPAKRVTGFMNTGAGIVDGLLLGWKLYKKFKRKI